MLFFHVENSVRVQNSVLVGYLRKWNMQHNREGINLYPPPHIYFVIKDFCRMPGDRPDKSHFVVKVLITWVRGSDKKTTTTVQNQDKRLYGEIIESIPSEVEAELIEKIRLEGASNGQKGYFYAILTENGQT